MGLPGPCWLGIGPSGPSQGPLWFGSLVGVGEMGEFFCHPELHSGRSCPVPNGVDLAVPRMETGWRGYKPYLVGWGRQRYSQGIASLMGRRVVWGITSLMRESQLWPGKALRPMGETQFLSLESPTQLGVTQFCLGNSPV